MITTTLQVSTQEPHTFSTTLKSTSIPNLCLSFSPNLLLLYDCQARFMDLVSQFTTTEIKSAIGFEIGNDLVIGVVTASHISILSLMKSKELFRIEKKAIGAAWLGGNRLGIIRERSIEVYDLTTREMVESINDLDHIVCYSTAEDENIRNRYDLYIGGIDGMVRKKNGKKELETIVQIDKELLDIQILNDILVLFTKSGCLKLWNLSSKNYSLSLECPESVSVAVWMCPTTSLLQFGFGKLNGDVCIYNQLASDVKEIAHGLAYDTKGEINFLAPHIISHKKSTKPIRSICFVNGSLIFSGDDAIVWKYSIDVVED